MIPTVLLLGLAVAAPLVSRRLTGEWFPPVAIVVSTWAIGIGLCLLYLADYYPLRAGTLWFLAATVAALAAGATAGAAIRRGRIAEDPPLPAAVWWVRGLSLAGLAGLAWYVAGVVRVLGWDGFRNGERLRSALSSYEIPSTFLVLQFFCMTAPLLAWALRLGRDRLRRRELILPAVCAAGTMITTDRTQLFSLLIAGFFTYVWARGPRLPVARLLIVGVACPLVLAGNFVIVDAWRSSVLAAYEMKLRIEGPDSRATPARAAMWRRATSAYFYATGAFPALQILLDADLPRTRGAYVAYPAARLLEKARVLPHPVPPYIPGYVAITPPTPRHPAAETNAYTFLYYPIRDFGRAGALAYAALVGLAGGLVFGWVRRDRGSALRLVVGGQVAMGLTFLPFINKFNNTAWWYVMAWTVLPFALAAVRARLGARRAPRSAGPV